MCLPIQQWHSGFHGFIKLITLTRFDVGLIPIGAYLPRWYVSSNKAFLFQSQLKAFLLLLPLLFFYSLCMEYPRFCTLLTHEILSPPLYDIEVPVRCDYVLEGRRGAYRARALHLTIYPARRLGRESSRNPSFFAWMKGRSQCRA